MRYYYVKPENWSATTGNIYICDHPVYHHCTLYEEDGVGLSVIQQRFDPVTKRTWWGEIDPWLIDDIYKQPLFQEFFSNRAGKCENELYPTVTVRQIMHALKMKPLKKQPWETVFDRKAI